MSNPDSNAVTVQLNQPGEARIGYETRGPWIQIGTCRGFEWTKARLPIANLPTALESLRLLHLSDFHSRTRWDAGIETLLERVQSDPPDLILFTGDFVENRYDFRPAWPTVKRIIEGLKARLGMISILGNHDRDLIGPRLQEIGVTLVDQRQLLISGADATIELVGLAGVERNDLDVEMLQDLGEKKPNTLRIALSHYPDTIKRARFFKPDLYLCGHTHGGQMCLPGRHVLLRHDSLPRKLCSGIHRAFDTWLIVNRGIGYSSSIPARVFCPSEAIEIEVVK